MGPGRRLEEDRCFGGRLGDRSALACSPTEAPEIFEPHTWGGQRSPGFLGGSCLVLLHVAAEKIVERGSNNRNRG